MYTEKKRQSESVPEASKQFSKGSPNQIPAGAETNANRKPNKKPKRPTKRKYHLTENVPIGDNVPAGPVEEQHNTNNGFQDQTPPGY